MTITTPCTEERRPRGFTLAEVMIASALAVFVMTGIMSSFLFIGRSGFGIQNYSSLAAETQHGLVIFAEDTRMACDIHWNSNQNITLTLPTESGTQEVTYAYDSDRGSATSGCFYRVIGDAASTAPRQILVRDVSPDFVFQRYKLDASGQASAAANDPETKQIQVILHARLGGATTPAATASAVSACYILRNKHVSN